MSSSLRGCSRSCQCAERRNRPEAARRLTRAGACDRSFLGESMDPESTMAYAYYREGAASPTFLFCKYALDAVKC